ncbi:hypothetical protein SPFM15_00038 [Salmonella phage SPFM15]|nr:hypothetical protein SPFM5_00033 [Salmonella phage SPFM5]VFR13662.1 hypothetical protein SPFM15_00038 [Salmonella phage SPFM15]
MVLWYYPRCQFPENVLKLSERFGTDIAFFDANVKLLQQVLYTHDWRGVVLTDTPIPVPHIAPVENLYLMPWHLKLLAERSEQCGGLEYYDEYVDRLLVNNIVWEDHGPVPLL